MRATRIVSGFASWRWAPCCALVTGSLLYVALIVLVVPKNLGRLPGTLSAPVGAESDMLTSDALGRSASLPSHHTPPAHTLATADLGDNTPPPGTASPRHHLVESRAAALGSPPPSLADRPTPPPAPPPAPPPPPEEPAPTHNEPPAEAPAPPAPPHSVVQRFVGGIHMIPPHLAAVANEEPAANDQPTDNSAGNAGGAGNEEEPQ